MTTMPDYGKGQPPSAEALTPGGMIRWEEAYAAITALENELKARGSLPIFYDELLMLVDRYILCPSQRVNDAELAARETELLGAITGVYKDAGPDGLTIPEAITEVKRRERRDYEAAKTAIEWLFAGLGPNDRLSLAEVKAKLERWAREGKIRSGERR
jgi:hypothetical protein